MIYDPTRAARDLKQRILESMTAEEIEEYPRINSEPPSPLLRFDVTAAGSNESLHKKRNAK